MIYHLIFSLLLHGIFLFFIIINGEIFKTKEKNNNVTIVDIIKIDDIDNLYRKSSQKSANIKEKKEKKEIIKENNNQKIEQKKETKSSNVVKKISNNDKKTIVSKEQNKKSTIVKNKSDSQEAKNSIKKIKEKAEKVNAKEEELAKTILNSLINQNSQKTQELKSSNDKINNTTSLSNSNQDLPLSISEISAIRSQIERSWNASFFSGNDNNSGMKVNLKIELDKNGNVINVDVKNRENNLSNSYQVFIDSAIKAVYSASPFTDLPLKKYNVWKEMEITFDSEGMIY